MTQTLEHDAQLSHPVQLPLLGLGQRQRLWLGQRRQAPQRLQHLNLSLRMTTAEQFVQLKRRQWQQSMLGPGPGPHCH